MSASATARHVSSELPITDRLAEYRDQRLCAVIDEIQNLKNEHVQARKRQHNLMTGRVDRMLGLSATPLQLRQDELLSILKLRSILRLPHERQAALDPDIDRLTEAMKPSRDSGDIFRQRRGALRPYEQTTIDESWQMIVQADRDEQMDLTRQLKPPRIAAAISTALELAAFNTAMQKHLHPFVIRHQHPRGYREHFADQNAEAGRESGTSLLIGGAGSSAVCPVINHRNQPRQPNSFGSLLPGDNRDHRH